MRVIPRPRCRTAPRRSAGCRRDTSREIVSRSMPNSDRHGGRREHVHQVAAPEKRRLDRRGPGRSLDVGAHPAKPRSRMLRARMVAPSASPNVSTLPGNRPGPCHDASVVGIAHQHGVCARAFQDLGLGVGDGVGGREEAQMRVADVGPHTHVRRGDLDEPADLACVIHPQFHHGDVRRRPQLHQRQGQSDVIVQVPLVLHHREPCGQQRRDRLLRRRLAGAPGDRDDPRRDRGPHRVRQPLQRLERVVDLDEAGPQIRTRATSAVGRVLLSRPGGPLQSGRPGKPSLDDRPNRAACEHVGDERMPVEPRATKRHEQIPGPQRPAVSDDVTNDRSPRRRPAAPRLRRRPPSRASS